MKYEDLERVNKEMKTLDVKGKDYVEVNQRIIAFRKLYPEGIIETEIVSLDKDNEGNGICVIKATVSSTMTTEGTRCVLGTGIAYEKENSTFINKTSYIENCETSAVGRALGMCGFGIDTSIASAEEVKTAIINQETMSIKDKIKKYGARASELLKEKNKKLSELTEKELQQLLETLENEN